MRAVRMYYATTTNIACKAKDPIFASIRDRWKFELSFYNYTMISRPRMENRIFYFFFYFYTNVGILISERKKTSFIDNSLFLYVE